MTQWSGACNFFVNFGKEIIEELLQNYPCIWKCNEWNRILFVEVTKPPFPMLLDHHLVSFGKKGPLGEALGICLFNDTYVDHLRLFQFISKYCNAKTTLYWWYNYDYLGASIPSFGTKLYFSSGNLIKLMLDGVLSSEKWHVKAY